MISVNEWCWDVVGLHSCRLCVRGGSLLEGKGAAPSRKPGAGGIAATNFMGGIPGSAAMAILMGALLMQGITPGPEMLTTRLDVTFSLVWMLVIANVAGALILMLLARPVARATFIRGHLLVPAIVLFVFMGAWLANGSIGDWVVLLLFGILGYLMKQGGVPRPPMVLGFVIGPIMENALFITNSVHDGLDWLSRPICLVIGALIVGSIVFGAGRHVPARVQTAEGSRRADTGNDFGGQADPTMALIATGLLLATKFEVTRKATSVAWRIRTLVMRRRVRVWVAPRGRTAPQAA